MNSEHASGELLAQLAPASTAAQTLFTAELRTELTLLFGAANNGGSAVIVDLYQDDGGTTYDNSTRVARFNLTNADGPNPLFQARHPGSGIFLKKGGSIGVQVSAANGANISLYGVTENIAPKTLERGRIKS